MQRLRGEPDCDLTSPSEMAFGDVERPHERADICSRLQQPDRPGHHWIWRFGVGQRVDDHLLQHSERRLRGRGLRHSLTDRRRAPTPEGVGGDDLIGQHGCWQPEHRAGGAGVETAARLRPCPVGGSLSAARLVDRQRGGSSRGCTTTRRCHSGCGAARTVRRRLGRAEPRPRRPSQRALSRRGARRRTGPRSASEHSADSCWPIRSRPANRRPVFYCGMVNQPRLRPRSTAHGTCRSRAGELTRAPRRPRGGAATHDKNHTTRVER